ncbi:hypothetical protein HU200_012224 [Digitaria exilis]|uniref:TFIIS N-terminal domain-containing protein n=1 Tax=Digitaria exilis TaxID=1010633 RepID=A0A835FFH5_9POAL|nr:hypothetical protein HU200_012224 [Digitaria exilis]
MADHPLRRWKPFLAAFGAIDAAIEAAGPDISRDEFRRARCVLVERLCDASGEDERDELCGHLDTAMVQSLLTLQMVPVAPAMLARTELVPAVRALKWHECEQVRALAEDIVCRWRATVEGDLVKVRAATAKLAQIESTSPAAAIGNVQFQSEHDANTEAGKNKVTTTVLVDDTDRVESTKISDRLVSKSTSQVTTASISRNRPSSKKVLEPRSKETAHGVATTTRSVRVESTKVSAALPRTTAALRVSGSSGSDNRGVSSCIDGKIEASKRRLREGYREEEDAKRQRKIQVIKAPDMVVVKDNRKQHPIMRERSRVRCASSVKVRRG